MRNFLFFGGSLIIICLAIALRWDGIDRGLEYDEIWPIERYRSKSVADLFRDRSDLYNLHALHNALMTSFPDSGQIDEISLRIPNLTAGVLAVLLVGILVYRITGHRWASLVAGFLATMSPGMIHYSQTARGYASELLFGVLLYAIVTSSSLRRASFPAWTVLVTLVTILLQLSVVTGVLIWLTIFGYYFAGQFRRAWHDGVFDWRRLAASTWPLVMAAGIAGAWLIWMHPALQKGQQFGEAFRMDAGFFQSLIDTSSMVLWPPLMLLFVISAVVSRKQDLTRFTLCLVLVVAISLPVTGLGPPRTYLYLLPFIVMVIAIGLTELVDRLSARRSGNPTSGLHAPRLAPRLSVLAGLMVVSTLVGGIAVADLGKHRFAWRRQIDYKTQIPQILQSKHRFSYLVFSSTDGRCASYYHSLDVAQNNFQHFYNRDVVRELLLVNMHAENPTLSVYDVINRSTELLSIPPEILEEEVTIDGVVSCRLKAVPMQRNPARDHGLLLSVIILPIKEFRAWERDVFRDNGSSNWYLVNTWLSLPIVITTLVNPEPHEMICAVYATEIDGSGGKTVDNAVAAMQNSNASFYWCGE